MKPQRLCGPALESYLADITIALRHAFAPQQIILFGSLARGDQNRASDLDVVVIADTPLPLTERIGRALEACYRASRRLPVEALVYTPAEWRAMQRAGNSFVREVCKQGRVLYDRESEPRRGAALADTGVA
jgi:predicted nucleotidyltransferase